MIREFEIRIKCNNSYFRIVDEVVICSDRLSMVLETFLRCYYFDVFSTPSKISKVLAVVGIVRKEHVFWVADAPFLT